MLSIRIVYARLTDNIWAEGFVSFCLPLLLLLPKCQALLTRSLTVQIGEIYSRFVSVVMDFLSFSLGDGDRAKDLLLLGPKKGFLLSFRKWGRRRKVGTSRWRCIG